MKVEEFIAKIKEIVPLTIDYKPHKHLILLTAIDLIENKDVLDNKFYFNKIFIDRFSSFFQDFHSLEDKDRPFESFFRLKETGGFWFLKSIPGREAELEDLKTKVIFRDIYEVLDYAYFLPEIYEKLCDDHLRCEIKKVVIRCLEDGLNLSKNNKIYELQSLKPTYSLYQHESNAIEDIIKSVNKYNIGKTISNLKIYDQSSGEYYECDVVVVGFCCIYIIELKHWSGYIQIAPYNWIKDNVKYRKDPHANNTFKARILKGIYQHNFRTYPTDIRVESVVVLTNPEVDVMGASNPKTDKKCPTFDSIETFIDYLRHQNLTNQKKLSLNQVERVAEYLESLQERKREKRYSIPGHEIVEHLTQKPDLIEVVARSNAGILKHLFRFRIFLPPTKVNEREKARFLKRAQNTLNAISQIGEHPQVLKVWPVPDETGAIIEGSDWSEQGTLKDWILERKKHFDEQEALTICKDILKALQAAHDKGVIHRAVKPENILMVDGKAKLMNFDLSYQLASEENLTVIPDVSDLKMDAYTAPEIYSGKDVDESTDLFAVGVILFELLTGERPFKASADIHKSHGRLTESAIFKLSARGVSVHLIDTITQLIKAERAERIGSVQKVLTLLGEPKIATDKMVELSVPNQKLEAGAEFDVYRIERLIGEGSQAQVYEGRALRDEPVALKLFNRDIPLNRILDEEQAGASVKSSYLVHSRRSGHWNNDRYFIVMDYIDGQLMRKNIDQGRNPDKKSFIHVAACLLEAVRAMHHRQIDGEKSPLIHGDIKPDNVIFKPDGSAVLFDFGCAGPPRIDTYQGTNSYVAPDIISGSDLQFCESGDLFALGVTLFEWLYGKQPYTIPILGQDPEVPVHPLEGFPESLLEWVLKAVQTGSKDRFESIEEMHLAFLACTESTLPEKVPFPDDEETEFTNGEETVVDIAGSQGNPFVAYLNSLHNASSGNENALAESQAVSPYFGYIHVSLKVTDHIYRQLADENGPHLILTGHAGDGKSTVGLELFKRCQGLALDKPLAEQMRPIEEVLLGDRKVVLIKDMSELTEEQRTELLKSATGASASRYFFISNTGTLLNTFKNISDTADWLDLQNRLLGALEAGVPKVFDFQGGRFQLINLARTDNISTACEIFEKMLTPSLWEVCESKFCKEHCPVYLNVRMLQENQETVKERVELTYRRLFEYGSRLTLRQITGHLAYSITSGLDYKEIIEFIEKAKRPPLRHFLFFNRFFGDRGEMPDPFAEQLKAAREIRTLEPGLCTHQRLERLLWTTEEQTDLPLIEGTAKPLFDHLRNIGSGKNLVETVPPPSARLQVRRMLFLFGNFSSNQSKSNFICAFLNSPMILEFTRWQHDGELMSGLEKKRLTQSILHVIQEHFTGVRLPESNADHETIYITLNRHNYEIRQSAQIVLARFPSDNFRFCLQPFDSGIGKLRYEARFEEEVTRKTLPLELPFLDYVTNRFHGEVAQKLQAFYRDRLERFKVELLEAKQDGKSNNMMIIRLQLNHRFRSHTVSVNNGALEIC